MKNKSTKILCIDIGTKMGWAINGQDGTEDFSNTRFSGGGMRFLKFRKWLETMKNVSKVDTVYFEEVAAHKGTEAAHAYGGFLSTLQVFCEENKIPYTGIPVGTIKKHATGKGNSGKPIMMAAYENKWGRKPLDDNSCDARFLLDYVESVNGMV